MRCISPLLLVRDGKRDVVPCGKCNFCLQTKRADWSFRLNQEWKVASSAHFLTLTYEDSQIPVNGLCKEDHQLFMKRLRKESVVPLRYYAVGEYGTETQRPHYHSIMFNLPGALLKRLDAIWQKGFVHVGDVTEASIHYVTKYVINKPDVSGGREPPFSSMSRRPGIGHNYLETHKKWHRADMRNYAKVNGVVTRLPRYYKEKVFTEMERAKLAMESVAVGDMAYLESVEKLSRFHLDPYYYYDERLVHAHDVVKDKANQFNTF